MDRTRLRRLRLLALGFLLLLTVRTALAGAADSPAGPLLGVLLGAAGGLALGLLLQRPLRTMRPPSASPVQDMQGLMGTAHEGLWLLDPSGATAFANPRIAAMLGLSEASLRGRTAREFLGENAAADLATVLSPDPVLAGSARDLCFRRADGHLGWAIVSGRPVGADHGLPTGTLLMLTDITERKKAELALAALKADLETRIRLRTGDLTRANEQLRAEMRVRELAERAQADSELRLHEIVSALPIALFLKDAQSQITMMNAACEEAFGVPLHEANEADARLPEGVRRGYLEADREAFSQRGLVMREEPIWNHARREYRRHVTYKKPVFAPDGTPLYLICLSVDIEERKRTEEALARSLAQLRQLTAHLESIKDEERRRIACDIHDELGQNLLALKMEAQILHARTAHTHPRLGARVAAALDTIDASIRSVRAIINDLHPSTLDLGLAAALEWQLGEFRKRSGVFTQLEVTGGDGEGLEPRLTATVYRAVQESLANVARHAQARAVTVRLASTPHNVSVTIQDDGVGMHEDQANGFGLRGMRERITALGGWLDIDSAPGCGTRVRLTLPLLRQKRREEEVPHRREEIFAG